MFREMLDAFEKISGEVTPEELDKIAESVLGEKKIDALRREYLDDLPARETGKDADTYVRTGPDGASSTETVHNKTDVPAVRQLADELEINENAGKYQGARDAMVERGGCDNTSLGAEGLIREHFGKAASEVLAEYEELMKNASAEELEKVAVGVLTGIPDAVFKGLLKNVNKRKLSTDSRAAIKEITDEKAFNEYLQKLRESFGHVGVNTPLKGTKI